jgi:hypothetical protein
LENGGGVAALNDPMGIIDFYSNDPSAFSNGVFGRISVNNEYNGAWNGTQGRVATYMAFSTSANATLSEKMRLRSNGVFSIGNANGTGSLLDIKPSDTTSNGIILSTTYMGTGSYGPLVFETSGTTRMTLTASGRLLIGTPPPTESTYQLDINGTGRFSGSTQDAIQTVLRVAGKNSSNQVKALDFKLTAGTPLWTISTAADGTDSGINIMPNGTAGLSLASTGAATFSSSVTANNFNTATGSVSNPFNVWTTMFSVSSGDIAMYQLIAASSGNGLTYTSSALVVVNGTGVALHNKVDGGALDLQTSGYDIQCKNGSGSTLTITYKYLKIS